MSNAVLERLAHTVANLAARLRNLETQEIVAANLPTHPHTSTATGGDYAWADITGFGTEPAAVSSSTSGTAGVATTASRGDHGHDLSAHAHSGATDGGQIAYSALTGALTQAAGTYLPTLTNVANLDSSTAQVCQYLRVGNVVTVGGWLTANSTAASTPTAIDISLPIASDFTLATDAGGCAAATSSVGEAGGIYANATDNRVRLEWVSVATGDVYMCFNFTYVVK